MTRRTVAAAAASLVLLAGGLIAAPVDEEEKARARLAEEAGHIQRTLELLLAAQGAGPRKELPAGFDAVLFTQTRPVRVRVTILFAGKPVAEAWRAALRGAFDYFDRDHDGKLSPKEVEFVFSDRGLAGLLTSGFLQPTPQDPPTMEKLDADGDGAVTFDEFVAYYKAAAGMLLRPMPLSPENAVNTQLTEALFKLFDKDGDGKLTKAELTDVERLLATQDADEDECLSINELLPGGGRSPARQVAQQLTPVRPVKQPDSFFLYETGRVPGTVTQRLITRYDRNGDYDLTRAESGFDEATFRRLDADGDGKLSGEELDAWRLGPPDLEVAMSVARRPQDCTAKLVTDPAAAAARGFVAREGVPGRLVIRVGLQPVEFSAAGAGFDARAARAQQREGVLGLFDAVAGDKGHVTDKDLGGPNAPRYQVLRILFDAADADADGKLTRKELERYLDVQRGFEDLAVSAVPSIQTPTLFQLLDENRDGRLSRRELRTAWDRLITLEAPGARAVSRDVIRPTMTVRMVRTTDLAAVNGDQLVGSANAGTGPAAPARGPAWFRKMDRNGDGDVSRAEFLGTKAEFDAVDADGDGLISPDEAEAYDRRVRKAAETKDK